jgi:hypothetical protein
VRTARTLALALVVTTLLSALVRGALPAVRAAREGEGATLTVQGDFRHPSGAVFPGHVGPFERDDLHAYDREGCEVSATYGLGPMWATYHVYPAGVEEVQAQFERVTGEIAAVHHGAAPLVTRAVQVAGRLPGLHAVYEYDESVGGIAVRVRSYAVLCRWGDWWLKWRVSALAGAHGHDVDLDFLAEDLVDRIAPAEDVLAIEPPQACRPSGGGEATA